MIVDRVQVLIVPCEWKAVEHNPNIAKALAADGWTVANGWADYDSTKGDGGVLEGYASTFGNIDLDDDIVEAGAFRDTINKDVRAGVVRLLADHMPRTRDVLGTVIAAREDKKGLRMRAALSAADDVMSIRTKMVEKHIDRLSIGYEPKGWRHEEVDGRRLRRLEAVKLWEISVVVFPANTQAVIERVKADVRRTIAWAKAIGVNDDELGRLRDVLADAEIVDLSKTVTPELAAEDVLIERSDLGEGVHTLITKGSPIPASLADLPRHGRTEPCAGKGAIRSHSTATVEGTWDANAAVSAAPNDRVVLRHMHAWVASDGDPDAKGSYKFPHHAPGADTAANMAGVRNGLSRLPGSTIPDGDKPGVEAHLRKHMDDAKPATSSTEPDIDTKDAGPLSLSEKLAQADALLAGRDPQTLADPFLVARNEARLEILAERATADPELVARNEERLERLDDDVADDEVSSD